MAFISLGWIFFRANSLAQAGAMFSALISPAAYSSHVLHQSLYLLILGLAVSYAVVLVVINGLDRHSERLEAAIARYHTNAVTTVEVLEELIKLAQEIRTARERGEESGLNEDEIAFYDALAENHSARDLMGEPALRLIAHELVQDIRSNITVDWAHREPARADIRRRVKRILRKYGYPPDLQDAAVQNVLQQAEVLSAEIA